MRNRRRKKPTLFDRVVVSVTLSGIFIFLVIMYFNTKEFRYFDRYICGFGLLLISTAIISGYSESKKQKARKSEEIDWYRSKILIEDLLQLTPYEFEKRIAQLFRDMGHEAYQVGQSGDNGVDVIVNAKNGKKWIVQCKQYSPGNKVSAHQIRDLVGAMMHEEADLAAVITTSSFTEPARKWAQGKPVELYDGEKLGKWLLKSIEKLESQKTALEKTL